MMISPQKQGYCCLVKHLAYIFQILGILLVTGLAIAQAAEAGSAANHKNTHPRQFRIWVFGDAHVGTDLVHGRESLADAIRQSEFGGDKGGPPFEWDIALGLGDFAGGFGVPTDKEGQKIVDQFGALKKHSREDIYCIAGNHDATTYKEPTQWWFRKWIDPAGENTKYSGVDAAKRKYKINGTWERYSFRVGNLLFLMMSDRNDLPPPVGRGKVNAKKQVGGYPAGAVTSQTFAWWKEMVKENSADIIISAHHHMLKNTTTGSGAWEGFTKTQKGTWRPLYHGYNPGGAPKGASYLYFVGNKPDAQVFEKFLAKSPGAIDFWLGGHTHLSPARETGGRKYIARKWSVNFINAAALSRYHNPLIVPPSSRLLTFTEGSDEVKVQYYLHTNDYYYQGWLKALETTVKISKPFFFSAN